MKILIVDDDPVARAVLGKILALDPEHQVTLAENGTDGWRHLDDPCRWFDVVFLDLSMPEPDGFELFRRIRTSPILKSIEVVLCTGANDRATVVKAAQLGARHYLVKPVTEPVVRAKLQQFQAAHASERRLAGFR